MALSTRLNRLISVDLMGSWNEVEEGFIDLNETDTVSQCHGSVSALISGLDLSSYLSHIS